MGINEKRLCAAMKAEWRAGGYDVVSYGEDNRLFINGSHWCVEMKQSEAPRKVLALLVEHLGDIPRGAAWRVSKDTGAQSEMVDAVLTRIDGLKNRLMQEREMEVNRTAMHWKGLELWQREDLRVQAYDGGLVRIGEGDPVECAGKLVWDENGLVIVLPESDAVSDTLRELLEQTLLA